MHWTTDVGHQIALCQIVVVAVLASWSWTALANLRADPNRGRISILAWTASWAVLIADFVASRIVGSPAWRIAHASSRAREAEWIVATVAILAMYLAYRNGRIQATGLGPNTPTVEERSAEAQERMASATEVIADQVAVMRQGTETPP